MYHGLDTDDDRMQPGAYVHHGKQLCEVLQSEWGEIALQDCVTDKVFKVSTFMYARLWELTKKAPTAPTFVSALYEELVA